MTATKPDLGIKLDEFWNDERCTWEVRLDHGKWWTVVLEWTDEHAYTHGANWVTYTWEFYDEALDVALGEAVAWCIELAPWKPCLACDGRGSWNEQLCQECHATGLASGGVA